MANQIDLSNTLIRTDLAVEAMENVKDQTEIDKGYTYDERMYDNVKVSEVVVKEAGVDIIGKKEGKYITMDVGDITDHTSFDTGIKILSEELVKLLEESGIKENDKCLIVGLGNDKITPDALGPMITERVLVTQHLFTLRPYDVEEGFRPVSAFSPGVMGTTGLETSDIINAIIKETNPDLIIAIDALASQAVERVNKTIQMTNTGIHPGSGVGNKRKEISIDTLGIPVIAIGVPTVVDAVTIVVDTMDYMIKHFSYEFKEANKPSKKLKPAGMVDYTNSISDDELISDTQKRELLGVLGELDIDEKRQLIHEVLTPIGYNLMVTPKEIDFSVEKMSDLISRSIDIALHRQVNY